MMLKTIVTIIVLALVALFGFAATKPDSFRVERSTTISAPAETVFPLINDLKQWDNWSPWANRDPDMKKSVSGSPAGVGAIYEWEGNQEVGQGRMEIMESNPPSKVSIKLNFIKPFEAENTSEFALSASGDSTDVTWAMFGNNTFLQKVMSVFFSMDEMVGPDFESGLSSLKALAEK
ncbi:MAG: SRPBCC family protein [Pseudomonadota bacterium]